MRMGGGQKQAGGWAGVIREDANQTDAGVRFCLIYVATDKCSCSGGTCHSEQRGQAEQGRGLLEGRGAVGDALLYERQAVGAQANW